MFKNFPVIVDTVQKSKLNNIVVNSNDLKTIKLSLTINQLNKPIDLTGATVRIAIVKPDKKTVFQDCTITDPTTGSCEVILNTQAFIISGVYIAEVMIYFGADTVAVTGRFSYSVAKGILDDSTAESANEWQSITQAIADAEGILIDLRENGTGVDAQARSELETVTTQLTETGTDLKDRGTNIKNYGALLNGIIDDATAVNLALTDLKGNGGGTLSLPDGNILIKSPIIISGIGVYLKASNPYKTRITAHPDFVGSALIIFDQDNASINKGIGIDMGLYVDCNNVPAHGITVVNAYDQTEFKNVEVRNCNDGFVPFNFIQKEAGKLGQTLLLENCIGEHFGNTSTVSTYYFERYQEINLIGVKAFINKPNSVPLNGTKRVGNGFYFKDCRGVTLTGSSAAFGDNAIVVHADTRNVSGITVVGQTNEQITGRALKTINNAKSISNITILPIRAEGPSGSFLVDNVTQSTLYTLDVVVELINGSTQNTVFTTDATKVINSSQGNSIIGLSNYNTTGVSLNDLLRIIRNANPQIVLEAGGGKKARVNYNASDILDTGVSIDKQVNGSYVKKVLTTTDTTTFYDDNSQAYAALKTNIANGYAGMLLTYRLDGVNYYKQVEVGSVDSGGTGYRVLRVPN